MNMKSISKALCVAVVVSASMPVVAQAGAHWDGAYCYSSGAYGTGAGYCSGSLLGFRNSSGPNDYASFRWTNDGYKTFEAVYGSNYYYCTPNASVAALWPTVLNFQSGFYIQWDAYGNCFSMSIRNASPEGNH